MNAIIISDIHGNINKLKKIENKLKQTDKIIILGDLFSYSHDNDDEIISYLNKFNNKIEAIRGNGDIPNTNALFNYLNYEKVIKLDNKKIYITHGHLIKHVDLKEVDFIMYGHTHTYRIEKYVINPGTLGARPRLNKENTYIEYIDNIIYLIDIDKNKILLKEKLQ